LFSQSSSVVGDKFLFGNYNLNPIRCRTLDRVPWYLQCSSILARNGNFRYIATHALPLLLAFYSVLPRDGMLAMDVVKLVFRYILRMLRPASI
jgi:hypothetical protein